MKIYHKKFLSCALFLSVFSLHLQAQTHYTVTDDAKFIISGTSTMHDWTMETQQATGEASISTANGTITKIQSLSVTIDAETLKSGKSGMDNNAYKALNTKQHPNISFSLEQIQNITKKEDHLHITATGMLTVAGTTKQVELQAQAYPKADTIRFAGNQTMTMSAFGVEPPTFLMGTIKTGNVITIDYQLTFTPK